MPALGLGGPGELFPGGGCVTSLSPWAWGSEILSRAQAGWVSGTSSSAQGLVLETMVSSLHPFCDAGFVAPAWFF